MYSRMRAAFMSLSFVGLVPDVDSCDRDGYGRMPGHGRLENRRGVVCEIRNPGEIVFVVGVGLPPDARPPVGP